MTKRPRETIMIPKSFRVLLFPLLVIAMLAATGTHWSKVSAGSEEWRPVDPAGLALKAAVVEPNADAEAIFWDISYRRWRRKRSRAQPLRTHQDLHRTRSRPVQQGR